MGRPFTFPGRYPVNGSNKQYAEEMAIKTAESHALRRAFDVNGIPSIDEELPDERPSRSTATRGIKLDPADFAPAPEADEITGEVIDGEVQA